MAKTFIENGFVIGILDVITNKEVIEVSTTIYDKGYGVSLIIKKCSMENNIGEISVYAPSENTGIHLEPWGQKEIKFWFPEYEIHQTENSKIEITVLDVFDKEKITALYLYKKVTGWSLQEVLSEKEERWENSSVSDDSSSIFDDDESDYPFIDLEEKNYSFPARRKKELVLELDELKDIKVRDLYLDDRYSNKSISDLLDELEITACSQRKIAEYQKQIDHYIIENSRLNQKVRILSEKLNRLSSFESNTINALTRLAIQDGMLDQLDGVFVGRAIIRNTAKKLTEEYGYSFETALHVMKAWAECSYKDNSDIYAYEKVDKDQRASTFPLRLIVDDDYENVWKELKSIYQRYQGGYEPHYYLGLTDKESELSYEQGKLIQNVIWIGEEIENEPLIKIKFITYYKMEKHELKYYLYWRSCFWDNEFKHPDSISYYYLCAYELIAEFGPFTKEQLLYRLEQLYKHYGNSLTHKLWVRDFAINHGLLIQDKGFENTLCNNTSIHNEVRDIGDLVPCDYSIVYEEMCKKTKWKIENNSFDYMYSCSDHIKAAVIEMLPSLFDLFKSNDLPYWDLFIGRIRKEGEKKKVYELSIWNRKVMSRILDDSVPATNRTGQAILLSNPFRRVKRKTDNCMYYCDPNLSSYIFKYSEMLFRKYMDYAYIEMPKKISYPGNEMIVNGYRYLLSKDPIDARIEKKYFELYEKGLIDEIIELTVKSYIESHSKELEKHKKMGKEKGNNDCINYKKCSAVEKKMVDYICSSQNEKKSFTKVLEIYDEIPFSQKKKDYKLLRMLIWGCWILIDNDYKYEQLESRVINNQWYLKEKIAIVNHDFNAALPYFFSLYNLNYTILARYINEHVIRDSVAIVFGVVDYIFDYYDIDIVEILLGTWESFTWVPCGLYDMYHYISNSSMFKNIGNIEIYDYDIETRIAKVERYSCPEESKRFIVSILMMIDKKFREKLSIKALVMNNSIDSLYDRPGYDAACKLIPQAIEMIIDLVLERSYEKKDNSNKYEVLVYSHNRKKEGFKYLKKITNIDSLKEFIQENVRSYYQRL